MKGWFGVLVISIIGSVLRAGTPVDDNHEEGVTVGTVIGGEFQDGPAVSARFQDPEGIAVDAAGTLFVADSLNHRIRKISTDGKVSTLAGSGIPGFADGMGTAAAFNTPSCVALDRSGNVYVTDRGNHRIRKISPSGSVSTLAGSGIRGKDNGPSGVAQFNEPEGVAVDDAGNVYVADTRNNVIRKISREGFVTTFAGSGRGYLDGRADLAKFMVPTGIAVDRFQNVFVSEEAGNRIRKITVSGEVSTIAGSGKAEFADGAGIAASFCRPHGIAVDASGTVYIADAGNYRIRTITSGGVISTLAGSGAAGFLDGDGAHATFSRLAGLTIDPSGVVYVTNNGARCIRKVMPDGQVSTIAGSGNLIECDQFGTKVSIKLGRGIAMDAQGNLYVSSEACIHKITPDGRMSTLAGTGKWGRADGPAAQAQFHDSWGIAVGADGSVYVADTLNGSIRKISPDGVVSTLAGSRDKTRVDGAGAADSLSFPSGISVDAKGNVYFAEQHKHRICKIAPDGTMTTFAGSGIKGNADGMGVLASFESPQYTAVDRAGNVYVTGINSKQIRKITPEGVVSTLAETRLIKGFRGGVGIAVDAAGTVYVSSARQVFKFTAKSASILAGSDGEGSADGDGRTACFWASSLAVSPSGVVYVIDVRGNAVRRIVQGAK